MAKKGRNKKFGNAKAVEIERGYTVVNAKGRRVYLSSHPDGMPMEDAEKLSEGLAADSQVVPIDQVIG